MSRLITMSRAHPVARGKAAANTGLNNPPVWTTVPTVTFTRGVTAAEDLTPYVTDPDVGQTVTISLLSGALPSGVTLSGNAYNYNGTAAGATASGLILRATDNGTSPLAADSSSHSVIISDVPAWTSVTTATFAELIAGQINLGAYVSNYSAATDVFSVSPAFTQIGPGSSYPWLTLTGTGGVLLTADGTQVDADDLPASPGLNIGVSRSGGPIVYSGAFAVTVYVVGSGVMEWADWSEYSYYYGRITATLENPNSSQSGGTWVNNGVSVLADYSAYQANIARRNDTSLINRVITPPYGGFFQTVWDEENPLIVVVPG